MGNKAPETIYCGAVVRTVDPASTVAQAFAVRDGTIVAVGADADIRSLAAPDTEIIDLGGATVVPGMVDNHTHQLLAGLDQPGVGGKVNIAQARSIAEIKALIAAEVRRVGPGKWIGTSCMFRGALEDNRFPDRRDLDEIAPHNPVYIFQSGKNVIANSLALRLADIGRTTSDPADPEFAHGHIVKDDAGDPTGHLIAGAGDLARRRWWEAAGEPMKKWDFLHFDDDVRRNALIAQMKVFNASGITATREMGASEPEIETYRQVAERGLATVRTDLIVGLPIRYVDTGAAEALIETYAGPAQGTEAEYWRIGGFKFVLQNDGFWSHPPEKARRLIRRANRLGWTLAIHGPAMSDETAWDRLMEVLEEANSEQALAGRRFSFEHWIGTRRAAHLARLKEWGFTVAPNPPLTYFGAGRSKRMHEALQAVRITKPSNLTPMEHARAEWGLHIRDWIDAGLTVTGGTDCPATSYDPERPLMGMYCARTQESLAGVLLPDQVVSPEEALRMWTIDGARSMGMEHRIGSIEPGKLADFVVLTGDPVTTADDALLDIKVLKTVVGGKPVYVRPG